jgi:PAS domain S-box-containing protein
MAARDIFRNVIEACPFGIVILDSDGRVVLTNSEMERMFGYTHDEFINKIVDCLIPALTRPMHVPGLAPSDAVALQLCISKSRQLSGRRKDGSEFPVEVNLNAFSIGKDDDLLLGVATDISERVRVAALKDEFIATVSHELRTPLTSISGALSLLVANGGATLSVTTLRLLTIAQSNSQRLVRLVSSILDMEKIESGRVVFALKRIEIRGLVEQAIEANRGFAEGYSVSFRLDETSEAGELHADPDWLMQVVTNLLSNAVKFSPPGAEVVVRIEKSGGNIRLSVRDYGRGVPHAFKARVFEKFAQADNSDNRTKGGTGLGLSIVKQIVARLGGEVGFSDAPGGGAIFHVDLPLAESVSADHIAATRPDHVGVLAELQP